MSRKVEVLRSGDCRVTLQLEAAPSGRKIDWRVLATYVDAEPGLITCVSDGQTVHPRAHGFSVSCRSRRSKDRRERRKLRNTEE